MELIGEGAGGPDEHPFIFKLIHIFFDLLAFSYTGL